jgi:hypothetical protein
MEAVVFSKGVPQHQLAALKALLINLNPGKNYDDDQ